MKARILLLTGSYQKNLDILLKIEQRITNNKDKIDVQLSIFLNYLHMRKYQEAEDNLQKAWEFLSQLYKENNDFFTLLKNFKLKTEGLLSDLFVKSIAIGQYLVTDKYWDYDRIQTPSSSLKELSQYMSFKSLAINSLNICAKQFEILGCYELAFKFHNHELPVNSPLLLNSKASEFNYHERINDAVNLYYDLGCYTESVKYNSALKKRAEGLGQAEHDILECKLNILLAKQKLINDAIQDKTKLEEIEREADEITSTLESSRTDEFYQNTRLDIKLAELYN